MTATAVPVAAPARPAAARVLAVGCAVALCDATFLFVTFTLVLGVATPARIFQGVARAVLGPAAADGGAATALLGFAMHVAVATAWTALWAVLHAAAPALRRATAPAWRAAAVGVAYGLAIWLGMNLVVVPLTRLPPRHGMTLGRWLDLGAHLLLLGPTLVLGWRAWGAPAARRA